MSQAIVIAGVKDVSVESDGWLVQAMGAIMMLGRGGRVERAIGGKTKCSGGMSDWKVKVEGSIVERVGIKRNNRIKIT